MNVARVLFTPELLIGLTRGRFEVIANAIPSDAVLRGVSYDPERAAVSLVVAHPSFPASDPGDVLPILPAPVVRVLSWKRGFRELWDCLRYAVRMAFTTRLLP